MKKLLTAALVLMMSASAFAMTITAVVARINVDEDGTTVYLNVPPAGMATYIDGEFRKKEEVKYEEMLAKLQASKDKQKAASVEIEVQSNGTKKIINVSGNL